MTDLIALADGIEYAIDTTGSATIYPSGAKAIVAALRASSPAEGAEPITDVQKWKDKLFSCESALGEARDEIESLIGRLNFTEELGLSWSRDNENLRKQLVKRTAALTEAVRLFENYGLVARRLPNDPIAAGRWFNDARTALSDEEQSTVIPGQL